MNTQTPGTQRRTLTNLALDSTMFIAFLIATAPRFTGIAVHEWLGIALGAAVLTHLVVHWSWIVGVTRRLFSRASGSARLNYLLNALLFIVFTTIIFTGLMISETALPLLGIRFERDRLWTQLHHLTSDAAVFLIGLHVALHWRWIVNAGRRLASRIFRQAPAFASAPALTKEAER
ncbi:MAG: DUF4405 domain-containing protein [Roseiflexaceae bacterium]|nr:DUF4405 domain-containing protein [Roseiflexus sp.]MDW8215300.1 DUF4405 domain-containing protein [Roseiflexaceae bacterium]